MNGERADDSDWRSLLDDRRGEIDHIDGQIIALLSKRQRAAAEIGNLTGLEYLGLGGNQLSGDVPDTIEIEKGVPVHLEAEDGHLTEAVISEIGADHVTLDLNHPLAGETLYFDVDVVNVRDATEEEIDHGHVHGPHGHHDH